MTNEPRTKAGGPPPAEPSLPLRWSELLAGYGGALLFAALLSWGWVAAAFDPPYLRPLALGWILALANAAAGLTVKWIGTGRDIGRFLLWAVGGSGLRLAILLMIVVAAHRSGMAPFTPFLIGTFCGFFSCMVCEILILHFSSTRDRLDQ
jgi:hypothetical protein